MKTPSFMLWLRALRVHQWAKNLLVFVPLLLSGQMGSAALYATVVGFVLLSLVASATYVLNDLVDRGADRMHPVKSMRPFASGALSPRAGIMAIVLLALASTAIAFYVPTRFLGVIAVYVAVTLAYSLGGKRAPVLDLIILAFLFTLRLIGGMALIDAPVSPWLLTFSMFFFFSIAAIKRYDETRLAQAAGNLHVAGRGYRASDAPILMALGTVAGFCATLVFCIYLVDPGSPAHDYPHPEWMWLVCVIVAYWLSRAWLLASRGEMHVDPVAFALRDRVSLALGVLAVAVSLAARW